MALSWESGVERTGFDRGVFPRDVGISIDLPTGVIGQRRYGSTVIFAAAITLAHFAWSSAMRA
jgi:hypothetical protein